MFLFDMSKEGSIAEICFTAGADIVPGLGLLRGGIADAIHIIRLCGKCSKLNYKGAQKPFFSTYIHLQQTIII